MSFKLPTYLHPIGRLAQNVIRTFSWTAMLSVLSFTPITSSYAQSEVPESLPEIIDTADMNKVWSFVTFVCVRHGQYQLYEDEYRFLKGELNDSDFEKNGIVQAILDELPLKRYLPSLATFSQHLVTIRKEYTSKDARYQAAVFKSMIITALNQEFLNHFPSKQTFGLK